MLRLRTMPGPSRLGMLYETLKASESSEYQKSFAIMEALAPIMMLDPFISTVDQMSANTRYLTDQGHRLLEIGVLLLLFASFEGFGIPYVAVPAIGLAAHRLSALQSVLLLALGTDMAKTKAGRRSLANRLLAVDLLDRCNFGCVCHGSFLGSRRLYTSSHRRNRSGQHTSRIFDQNSCIFVRPYGYCFFWACSFWTSSPIRSKRGLKVPASFNHLAALSGHHL
jgi:hypothetical protein